LWRKFIAVVKNVADYKFIRFAGNEMTKQT